MKSDRQLKILEIIGKEEIRTQEDLLAALRREGYEATQATISRDIRELKLTKASDKNGSYKYTVKETNPEQSENKYERILIEAAISSSAAVNLVVIKTYSGMANAACAAIDRLAWKEVAGSIAGDDTIFIACFSEQDARAVLTRLKEIIKK